MRSVCPKVPAVPRMHGRMQATRVHWGSKQGLCTGLQCSISCPCVVVTGPLQRAKGHGCVPEASSSQHWALGTLQGFRDQTGCSGQLQPAGCQATADGPYSVMCAQEMHVTLQRS